MKNILVIEDATDVREIIVEGLKIRGWQPAAAADGERALALLNQSIPDLILCDIKMPGMDGYAVLDAVRSNPATATIPFVFLTGLSDRPHMREGMVRGADDYLLKPFTVPELLAAVEAQFRKQDVYSKTAEKKVSEVRESLAFALPHELVTPLNTILGYSALLMESESLQLDAVREYGGAIKNAGERLQELVEKFLLHAQLESIASDHALVEELRRRQPAPLQDSVETVAWRFTRLKGREKDLKFHVENVSHAISEAHLERVVRELIENAAKFSAPGTPILVALRREPAPRISVTNQGMGFTPEQVRNISANLQFDRKLREQQGTGLGLGIVRRIVELYRGRFDVQSAPGGETTVSVELPR